MYSVRRVVLLLGAEMFEAVLRRRSGGQVCCA